VLVSHFAFEGEASNSFECQHVKIGQEGPHSRNALVGRGGKGPNSRSGVQKGESKMEELFYGLPGDWRMLSFEVGSKEGTRQRRSAGALFNKGVSVTPSRHCENNSKSTEDDGNNAVVCASPKKT